MFKYYEALKHGLPPAKKANTKYLVKPEEAANDNVYAAHNAAPGGLDYYERALAMYQGPLCIRPP